MKIYIASKAHHRARWRQLREEGAPINSRWIDVDDKYSADPSDLDYADLWSKCVTDVTVCDALVVYVEPGEILKGALVEMGIAIGMNIPVFLVGRAEDFLANGTWMNYRRLAHPVDDIVRLLFGLSKP
jgi:nucleoside 2-deoxyribosyltransferase